MTNQQFRILIYVLLQSTTAICSAIGKASYGVEKALDNIAASYKKLEE